MSDLLLMEGWPPPRMEWLTSSVPSLLLVLDEHPFGRDLLDLVCPSRGNELERIFYLVKVSLPFVLHRPPHPRRLVTVPRCTIPRTPLKSIYVHSVFSLFPSCHINTFTKTGLSGGLVKFLPTRLWLITRKYKRDPSGPLGNEGLSRPNPILSSTYFNWDSSVRWVLSQNESQERRLRVNTRDNKLYREVSTSSLEVPVVFMGHGQ